MTDNWMCDCGDHDAFEALCVAPAACNGVKRVVLRPRAAATVAGVQIDPWKYAVFGTLN